MALCRFRIPDNTYELLKQCCAKQNKTVSEVLMEFVATKINENGNCVATENRTEESCGHTDIDIGISVATDNIPTIKPVATTEITENTSVATNIDDCIPFYNDDGTPVKQARN